MKNDNYKFNHVIIAAGPVIIKGGKVLLNKHGEGRLWKFPGGDIYEATGDLESWACKKAKEEMGLDVKLIRPLKPMLIWQADEVIILIHYLAEMTSEEIKPADYILDYQWLDINNLPADCSPNIKPVVDEYKNSIS
ncbi:MAG: NUDIX domain-containing protein [Patescibacteria group bacterium]|jgi:ADP-ribose pyrophosphatase YjhB (NUDIX family)